MPMNSLPRFIGAVLFAFAALLTCAPRCGAQSNAFDGFPATSWVFASPNTRASLVDQDARASIDSFEQANATAVADRIACSMTHEVRIADAVGIYDTSAENSFVVMTNLAQARAEYLGMLLARYAHQRFVLVFLVRPAGPDRLWTITAERTWDSVVGAARELQVTPLTVRAEGAKTTAIVVDSGSKMASKLGALADRMGAHPQTTNGVAELLGNDDRAKAATLFEQKINSAEKANGRHLSRGLWTERWHDATSRTCSAPSK